MVLGYICRSLLFSKKFLVSGCVYIAISLSVPILIYQCQCIFFFLGVEYRYEQSEFIERELEQMTEQIKSIIEALNANQVNTLSSMFSLLNKYFFLTDAND